MKKYNNKSKKLSDWTTKKLKDEAINIYDCIHGHNACFNSKDIMHLQGTLTELEKRGVKQDSSLRFE